MKAITILEPFPTLIKFGLKGFETRGWATKYRGKIAIHAGISKKYKYLQTESPFRECLQQIWQQEFDKNNKCTVDDIIVYGAVIAIADLVDCARVTCRANLKIGNQEVGKAILENDMIVTGNELAFGDFTYNRYAWKLDNVQPITPVPAKGQQGLWNWDIPIELSGITG